MQMDILPEDLGRVCGVVRLCTQGRVDLWMSGFGVGRVDGNHEGCGWGGGGELSASRVICVREERERRRWTLRECRAYLGRACAVWTVVLVCDDFKRKALTSSSVCV